MTAQDRTPTKSKTADPSHAARDFEQGGVEAGSASLPSSFADWTGEGRRFVDQMIVDTEETLDQFKRCNSPFDVLLVQQGWLAARAKAYLQAGLRLTDGSDLALPLRTPVWPFGD